MTTVEQTAEQVAEQAQRGRGVWVAITIITMITSLGLNIAHALVYKEPPPAPGEALMVELSNGGRVFLGLLSGVLPVVMAGFMSHALFASAPGPVRFIVVMVFLIGMGMSLTAQYELFHPAVGALRAVGTVAVIDIPALTALFMIERGNRAQKTVERLAAERARQARERAERERRERAAAERQAAEQAAAERVAERQQAAAQAAERAAEAERQAAEQAAEAARLAAEQAAAEVLVAERKQAAERAEAERQQAAAQAAEQAAEAERARAARMEAQQRAEAARRETERLAAERAEVERRAEVARREAARRERAERQARAEQGERDLTPAEKRAVILAAYQADPTGITAIKAAEAVAAKGGTISEQRARAILADVRRESGGLAEVRTLRSAATG